jgi:conjugative transfer region protein (TIGR03750 family)
MEDIPEDTANLIDAEPVLFLGCNNSEIMNLAGIGFLIGLFVGIVISVLIGIGILVLPFLIVVPMLTIYFGGKRLGKAKEGKPDGFYGRMIASKLNAMGFGNSFVTRSGYWRNTR